MSVTASKAEVCPVCHQKIKLDMHKTVTLAAYGVITVLAVLAFLIIQSVRSVNQDFLRQSSTVVLIVPDARILAMSEMRGGTATESLYNARDVTAEDFKKIKVGMKSEDLLKMLHYRGTITARRGTTSYVRHWQNPNGTNISALFENNRLVTKMQFGLLPEPNAKNSQ